MNTTDLNSGRFEEAISLLAARDLTVIQDPEQIKAFFQSLFLEQLAVTGTVSWSGGGSPHDAEIRFPTEERIRLSHLEAAKIGQPPASGRMTVTFSWLERTYCFFTETPVDAHRCEFPLPEKVFVVHRRFWDRAPLRDKASWKATVVCREGRVVCAADVLDISHRGIGLRCTAAAAEAAELFTSNRLRLSGAGISDERALDVEIVHITRCNGDAVIGCRVQDASLAAQRGLYSMAVGLLYPDIVKVRTDEDRKTMNSLLARSSLGGGRAPRAGPVPASNQAGHPGDYFFLTSPTGGGAVLAAHQVHGSTWMIHTLGLTPELSTALPERLFHRVGDYVIGEMGASFLCGYWPAQSRVLDRSYTAFVQQDFDAGDHHFEVVHIYQYRSDATRTLPPTPAVSVTLLEPADWAAVKELLRSTCSPIYWDAADLDALFSTGKPADVIPGLHRHVLVAKRGEHIAGVAIVQWSRTPPPTMNLSNHFRLFLGQEKEKEDVARALFRSALNVYHTAGIGTCTLYLAATDGKFGPWPGLLGHLERVYFWIARTRRAKAFVRHLAQLKWELEFLDRHRAEIKPSVLKRLRFRSEPFRRRECARLESGNLDSLVRSELVLADGRQVNVSLTSLDTFGCSIQIPSGIKASAGDKYKLRLRVLSNTPVELEGEVKYVIDRPAPAWAALSRSAGLRFRGVPSAAASILREFAFRQLNPDLSMFDATDYTGLTGLFEAAKYFDYYEGADHARFVAEGQGTYSSLERLHPDLARITVLKDGRRVIGSHSFYRLTPRTWQLHQLVVDETLGLYKAKLPTKLVLQGTFEYLTLDPTAEYFLTYFHNDAAIAKTYFEVRNHHDNSRDYAYLPFRGFVFEDLPALELAPSGRTNVGLATSDELTTITGYLETLVPRIEYDALDFGDLRQSHFLGTWRNRGFTRERQVFVARNKKNELLHFAIANVSPQGANLISLLDIYRLFDLPWCVTTPEAARLDLATYVAAYYKEKGRTQVYLEVDETAGAHYEPLPARDLGKNWRLIASRPSFMTALQFFATRFEKLEKRMARQPRPAASPAVS